MGEKASTSRRLDDILSRMLSAEQEREERERLQQEEQQPQDKPRDDDMKWEQYRQRQRDFDDIRFARATDEQKRRDELRGGS